MNIAVREMPYEVGKTYQRKRDIHGKFRGQERGGISTPAAAPFVFLFTGDTGEQYGYEDKWTEDGGVFLYTGEGQTGDIEFDKGNKAIREHGTAGKDLLLFEALGKGKGARFKGQFSCDSWEFDKGTDKLGNLRRLIIFHLVPLEDNTRQPAADPGFTLDELRRRAYEASRDVAERSSKEARRSYYKRSDVVAAYVLNRAAGVCEACKKPAPFRRPDGSPYLEPHHTHRVSDGGPDDPRWVGGICPNCHREIHCGVNGDEMNKKVQEYVQAMSTPSFAFPQSLAEKYRPRTITEFVGLEKPKKILTKFIRAPYPSAWLFVGPSGVGKTSMAQSLCAEISAELHHIPSQKCTVEAIEKACHDCHYLPFSPGGFHVVLCDEADRMSNAAQLALLSKLDATAFPPNTIFIFTCNSTDGLEPRFLSRCRLIEFSSYGMATEIAEYLEKVWHAEGGIGNGPDLARLAKESRNNVRDCLMRLEVELMAL